MPVDIVCGLAVPVKSTSPRHVFQGKSYYFCSKACAARFHAHPGKFVFAGKPPARGPKSARERHPAV